MLNFQEQVAQDLDDVFFNASAKEFVTKHKISGIRGINAPKEIEGIVDKELYVERKLRDDTENVTLDGFIFFTKETHWLENFKRIPKVRDALIFDGERYQVEAVGGDFGSLEIMLEANRGM